jgi:predicted esterase
MKQILVLLLLFANAAHALTQLRAPAWRCDSDRTLTSGFENLESVPPERPSFGSGGDFEPGAHAVISSMGFVTYYLSGPSDYAGEALPLIMALHGAGGPGTQAFAASNIRNAFEQIYGANTRFLIAAPESSGSQGGWIPSQDEIKIRAVIADMKAKYNVDLNRVYGWGYSAGGQIMHGLALSDPSFAAAYTGHATRLLPATSSYGTPETFTSRVPVLLTHGINDTTVPYTTAQADRLRFLNAGWTEQSPLAPGDFELIPFDLGHFYDTVTIQQSWDWMCVHTLLP